MWHATPISAARIDNRNSDPCARMLAVVAAALPETTSIPWTITWPNPDVRASSNSKMPAILAFTRGDISVLGAVIIALLIVSRLLGESDRPAIAAQSDRREQECRRD